MYLGRIIGTLIGFSLLNFLGAIIGYSIGGMFDRGAIGGGRAFGGGFGGGFGTGAFQSAEQQQKIQAVFFKTVFSLMGKLAKADGRVSQEEVAQTERAMTEMGLTSDHRREAIRLFKQGSGSDLDVDALLDDFLSVCNRLANLKQMVLVQLISIALADGELHSEEERLLRSVALRLGYPSAAFDQLIRMIKAQDRFGAGGGSYGGSQQSDLPSAYEALGVKSSDSDAVIKKAYRKLMSEFHPDKLMGQGVPEDMVKVATERSQEIQAAYDLIKRDRKA